MVIEDFSSRPDPYLATVMAVSATEVDVTFNMPMLPQSGMNSPANYSLSGAGAGTLTANPDTVTKLMAPGGPVYRLTWNGGATTGDPATLTLSNVENSRGVAIGSANTASFTTVAGPSSISDWFLID
jgi:hypothetical protein